MVKLEIVKEKYNLSEIYFASSFSPFIYVFVCLFVCLLSQTFGNVFL